MQNYTLVETGKAFTQAGVDELLKELYQLPNFELQEEADAMAADFRQWVATRFDLKDNQQDYLKHLDDQTVKLTGNACGFALANRLPIYVEKPVNQTKDEDPPFKNLRTSTNLRSKSAKDGSSAVGGHVTVEISYA